MPNTLKKKNKRKSSFPLIQLLLSASAILALVGISILLTSFVQVNPIDPEEISPSVQSTPDSVLSAASVSNPPLTPTPAINAPFGVQYGFGSDYLLPGNSTAIAEEEPILFTPNPTPSPTATS